MTDQPDPVIRPCIHDGAWTEDQQKERFGYMCRTDFNDEVGNASGGTKVYPSVADLRRRASCAASCGIVRVAVRCIEIVCEGTDNV